MAEALPVCPVCGEDVEPDCWLPVHDEDPFTGMDGGGALHVRLGGPWCQVHVYREPWRLRLLRWLVG